MNENGIKENKKIILLTDYDSRSPENLTMHRITVVIHFQNKQHSKRASELEILSQ